MHGFLGRLTDCVLARLTDLLCASHWLTCFVLQMGRTKAEKKKKKLQQDYVPIKAANGFSQKGNLPENGYHTARLFEEHSDIRNKEQPCNRRPAIPPQAALPPHQAGLHTSIKLRYHKLLYIPQSSLHSPIASAALNIEIDSR